MYLLRILLASLFLLLSVNVFAMGKVSVSDSGGLVGKTAADVTLPSTDGTSASIMSARKGGNAILIFWASWCPHCREELAHVNKDLAGIEGKGIQVILIDAGEDKDVASEYLMKHRINMVSFLDEENVLQEQYQVMGIPTVVFISAQGKILDVDHEVPVDYAEIFNKK